jgi:hypothetical protein
MRRLRHSDDERQLRMLPKAEMPKAEGELPIMKRIISTIQGMGIMCWRNHVGATNIGGRWQRFGEVGSPDLFCVVKGRLIGIEVKRPGGKLSPEQEQWGKRLELAGGLFIVAMSTDEAVVPLMELLR